MENTDRKLKLTANGGVVANKPIVKKDRKQKNYVIEKDVIQGIKDLAKEFGMTNDSEMLEEMYYAFVKMVELGKKAQEPKKTRNTKKGKTEETK